MDNPSALGLAVWINAPARWCELVMATFYQLDVGWRRSSVRTRARPPARYVVFASHDGTAGQGVDRRGQVPVWWLTRRRGGRSPYYRVV